MCSLRSCPTQNARPVPVSTTQRTAGSSATRRTVSSSSILGGDVEAVHRLGPVEGDGGDAVGHVEENRLVGGLGLEVGHGRSLPDRGTGQEPGSSPRTGPRRAGAAPPRRRRARRPPGRASRRAAARRAARGRRTGTCATRARARSGPRTRPGRRRRGRPAAGRPGPRRVQPVLVRRAQGGEVPGGHRRRVELHGPRGPGPRPGPLEHEGQLRADEGADPDAVGELGVPHEGQVGAHPGAGAAVVGSGRGTPGARCRPRSGRCGRRSARRPRRGGAWRARWPRSRGPRRA